MRLQLWEQMGPQPLPQLLRAVPRARIAALQQGSGVPAADPGATPGLGISIVLPASIAQVRVMVASLSTAIQASTVHTIH